MVRTFNPASLSRITLHDVRVVPGFGSNLLSTPRMEKAGWYLSQGGGQFKASDGQGRLVFTVTADFKGLYYLKNVMIFQATTPAPSNIRGQRKFLPDMDTPKNSSASQFFAMGVNDKNCQVNFLPSAPVCRLGVPQATRCDTDSHLCMQVCERSERSLPSPIATPLSSPLPLSPGPQGLQATRGPGLVDPMGEESYEGVALAFEPADAGLLLC